MRVVQRTLMCPCLATGYTAHSYLFVPSDELYSLPIRVRALCTPNTLAYINNHSISNTTADSSYPADSNKLV